MNRSIASKGDGALGHLLDHDPIRTLGATQGEDLLTLGGENHQRVHFARTDGLQGLLAVRKAAS